MYTDQGAEARPLPMPWAGSIKETQSALRKLIGPRAYLMLRSTYAVIRHEARARTGVPLDRKLALWRRGFYAESEALYDFPHNDRRDYLSDFAQSTWCREVNAQNEMFNHKLVLRSFLLAMQYPQADTVALIHDGRVLADPFIGPGRAVSSHELGERLAAAPGAYIVKPEDGAGGEQIFLLESREGRLFRRSGKAIEPFNMVEYVARLAAVRGPPRMTLVERRLEQGPFWAGLFPESANTIRALTLWTPGEPAPFLARAVQRIGTADTVPTDNWSGGGISAPIDPETGRLGEGRMHPLKGRRTQACFRHHPDTGAAIAEAVLPAWPAVREVVLRAAASVPFNRMAGWDVLVDGSGTPVILEANGNSDVNLLQVHGGLLAEPRIRRFYQAVRVI